MEFEGKVWKDGKFWLVEVPALNVMTQGTTKKEVLEMAQDALDFVHFLGPPVSSICPRPFDRRSNWSIKLNRKGFLTPSCLI